MKKANRKYRPIGDKVVVKIIKEEKYFPGTNIVMPEDSAVKESQAKEEGIIIALGGACQYEKGDFDKIEVGDLVAFARYGGKSLGNDKEGNELRVMRDIDILVVIDEEK